MTYNIVLYLNYIEEYIIYIILYSALIGVRTTEEKKGFKKIMLYFAFFPLLSLLTELGVDSFAIQKLVLLFIEISSIIFLYHPGISETISLYIVNYTFIYAIQEGISFFSHHFIDNIEDYRFGLLANLITIVIVYIISRCINLYSLFHYLSKEHNPVKLIVINAFLLLQIVDYYYKVRPDIYNMNIVFIGTCIIIVIILNFLIFFEENRIIQKDMLLKNARLNSLLMQDMITEIRRTQHQYDNRLNSIIALANVCDDFETLRKELQSYSTKLATETNNHDILKLNYKLVAALIFSKTNEAKAVDKTIKTHIYNYNLTTQVSEYELVDILGIMINNMLDAIPSGSECELNIRCDSNKVVITTKNEGPKITPSLQKKLFSRGYTTKNEKSTHGFGLYNLRKIVLEHDGSFMAMNEYSADKQKTYIVFTVEV